ncbi:MAG: S9 family peptidase [Pseudomonadota bacterium]
MPSKTPRQNAFPQQTDNPAPVAPRQPETISQHGHTRTDPFGWMRDDNWQQVLRDPSLLRAEIADHLKGESRYYETATADLAPLREKLVGEMRGRIKEDDQSVPFPDGAYAYGTRFRTKGEYPVFVRTPREGGAETILFDGEKEAEGADFFDIGAVAHSPDHTMIAYAVDRLGSEYYDIRIRTIATGKEHQETIRSSDGNPIWSRDSLAVYYVERDDHQRPKRVRRHELGTDPANDPVLYEEADDGFFLSLSESQSGDYIFIDCGNSTSSEVRYIRADAGRDATATLIATRTPDVLYSVDHCGDYFYIKTNADDAIDFKICRAPIATPGRDHWEIWLDHSPGQYLLSFIPFKDRLVRLVRANALPRVIIATYDRTEEIVVGFDEDAYAVNIAGGFEFDTDDLRLFYSSPTTPRQTYDYKMKSGVRTLRHTQEVPSGHEPARYVTERIMARGHDGVEIPVTIVRLREVAPEDKPPLMLYGYGSYGITIDTGFSTAILSLVDRGVVYATAHIRGGSARGRQWYLDGKLGQKPNTFHDFIATAESLQALGYGANQNTVIYGGSAGGLLVGACVNMRPDLFAGVIGAVPFVDVVTTISDATLPLTPPEWDEWGNPITDAAAYQTILSYSPYDNLDAEGSYPPILATGGLADYRVTYWEPAKWIARLRAQTTGGPYFLKMNMEAGHGGSAARFEALEERAHNYAFALKIFGLPDLQTLRQQWVVH